jgi:hypothetical protein
METTMPDPTDPMIPQPPTEEQAQQQADSTGLIDVVSGVVDVAAAVGVDAAAAALIVPPMTAAGLASAAADVATGLFD